MAGNVYPLRTIEDEASEWVARVERGCTPEQRQRLDDWLAANPRHRSVFEEMTRHWRHMSTVAEVAGRLNRRETARARGRLIKALPGALAAALILTILGVYLSSAPDIYTTDLGAHRTVTLTDNSTVDLNTATRIEIDFTPDQRLVRLTAGEALFKVAHEPNRPFTVIAGSSIVRAVGTAFAIRLGADSTKVVVTEGRVAISSAPFPLEEGPPPTVLSAGEAVSITTAIGPVANINPQELDRTLAWRRGVLNIQGQPLGEVIAEVERYTATRFVIADPALTAIEVGGYFKATDIEAFLTLLEGQFPIRAERPGPGVIVLHHRAAAPG